jgi:hypothetical protein
MWSRTYGGSDDDHPYSVVQTLDGGYALGGYTDSFGAVGYDGWLVKFDSAGNFEWNTTYGGADWDICLSLVQTLDGGYALGGFTYSFGAVTGDGWLVKFDSAGTVQWNTTFGGSGGDQGWSVVQTLDGGYALGGYTTSFGAVGWDGWLVKFDSAGTVQWNTTFGGSGGDYVRSVVQTLDGGYALGGYTDSFGAVDVDGWLVKLDSAGTVQWNKTYGGPGNDYCHSLVQTFDEGYALGGNGWLVKFDSAGNSKWETTCKGSGMDYCYSLVQALDGGYALGGYTTSFGAVGEDGWLVKFDSAGTVQWNKTYGGAGNDHCRSLVQTLDGGYALGGYTTSFGAVGVDGWLVKVSGEMNLEHQRNIGGTVVVPGWKTTFGGSGIDSGWSLIQTLDGGYALGGQTSSFGAVGVDGWLVKFNSAGTVQWNTTYGGASEDRAQSLIQTLDGGYALGGYTNSFGAVDMEGWLVKFNSVGTVQWNTTYGGAGDDICWSVVQTLDGGYAMGGFTYSFGATGKDGWLVKFDSAGTVQWNTTFGGSLDDQGWSLIQTLDGGYALGGNTHDVATGTDGWLVKFDSAGNFQWETTYGGAHHDQGYSLVQTLDGGYALGGYTDSFGLTDYDGWLVKFDSAGNFEWNTTYGEAGDDYGRSLVQTLDGGYALGGETYYSGAVDWDGWLVKFDSDGNFQWDTTYGGTGNTFVKSVVQTLDGGYALGGITDSFGIVLNDGWLVKTDVENGLAWTSLTNDAITLYRGKTDCYWNYLRVRIWTIKEPTWMFGDINQDGIVDIQDVAIVGQNYGQTFSLLSLTGIIAVAGIHTYKKRKQPN